MQWNTSFTGFVKSKKATTNNCTQEFLDFRKKLKAKYAGVGQSSDTPVDEPRRTRKNIGSQKPLTFSTDSLLGAGSKRGILLDGPVLGGDKSHRKNDPYHFIHRSKSREGKANSSRLRSSTYDDLLKSSHWNTADKGSVLKPFSGLGTSMKSKREGLNVNLNLRSLRTSDNFSTTGTLARTRQAKNPNSSGYQVTPLTNRSSQLSNKTHQLGSILNFPIGGKSKREELSSQTSLKKFFSSKSPKSAGLKSSIGQAAPAASLYQKILSKPQRIPSHSRSNSTLQLLEQNNKLFSKKRDNFKSTE